MNAKRIVGFILMIGGIALILFSAYIDSKVKAGKEIISSAETKVNQGKTLFSLNPVTKEIGKGLSNAAEEKLGEGKALVAKYEKYSNWLMFGGVGLTVLGLGVVVLGRKKHNAK